MMIELEVCGGEQNNSKKDKLRQGNSQITITSIKCGPGHGIRYIIMKCSKSANRLDLIGIECVTEMAPRAWF
ncbi:hypothetical protein F2Q70_00034531 [Brassica cretica]|uniref:Uncharacterized protein n=1 Tax=Brassica cretica TaxID=69181 RepID=A0A8S9JNS6_BRACR|nr:hypothetical protein F2Q70_00034531 [Brassica cretica]